MAEYRIGVIGIPGKWSTETLADAVAERTGYRQVIDMGGVNLDLDRQRLLFQDQDLCRLDALIVKKISATYNPNTLDRLELLRVAEQAGVRVFSRAENTLRLIDRLSCTVTLRNAGIPMPATRVTEDVGAAITAVQDFGSAVFKPLYSTKARGMCIIEAQQDHGELEREIRAFQAKNPMMYIQQKIELPGRDLGWCSWRVNTLAPMPGCRRTTPGIRPYTVAAGMTRIHHRIPLLNLHGVPRRCLIWTSPRSMSPKQTQARLYSRSRPLEGSAGLWRVSVLMRPVCMQSMFYIN